jgi:recombination protein RecR
MSALPPAMEQLINELSRLPTIGRRSAERLAFHLLRVDAEDAETLAHALRELRRRIVFCRQCFNIAEGELCPVCLDPRRDRSVLCVVEDPRDILVFENSGAYRGLYHVLGGHLSPLKGIGPEQLRIGELLARLGESRVKELILATNPSVDGDATALFIQHQAAERVARITRIGLGIPIGSSFDHTDSVTIQKSLEGRRPL